MGKVYVKLITSDEEKIACRHLPPVNIGAAAAGRFSERGENVQMREYWDLFITFARIGGFTFGGGYAMLPILQRDVVETKHWATEEELMDYYAIGQCTPGIIAVNTATFIGSKRKGFLGGVVATLGMVFPSLVIISIIAAFINNFSDIPWVQHALAGIRVCVCVLVFDAVLKLAKKSLIDAATYIIFGAIILVSLFTNVQTFIWVIAAGVAGVVIKSLMEKTRKDGSASGEGAGKGQGEDK